MKLDDLLGDLEKNPEVKKAVDALKKTLEPKAPSIASRVAARFLQPDAK
jgi:hypothetical protein